jgi:hypothetical protein
VPQRLGYQLGGEGLGLRGETLAFEKGRQHVGWFVAGNIYLIKRLQGD